jgi:hypothetical protein
MNILTDALKISTHFMGVEPYFIRESYSKKPSVIYFYGPVKSSKLLLKTAYFSAKWAHILLLRR